MLEKEKLYPCITIPYIIILYSYVIYLDLYEYNMNMHMNMVYLYELKGNHCNSKKVSRGIITTFFDYLKKY